MINNISFAGRETMLTSGLEKAAAKIVEQPKVVKASTYLEETVPQVIAVPVYTSPFEPITPTAVVDSVKPTLGNILNFFG